MTDVFKSYTATVRKLLLRYDKDLSSVFIDQNIEEIWQSHDNWNGGIDFYAIRINVPIEVYYKLSENSRIEEAENKIAGFYSDILKGYESIQIQSVAVCPNDNGQVDFGINANDSMWKLGYFRLFISHLSEFKERASALKSSLTQYGIDCFVAHEDITPSKEWEIEIENALFSMDALCAIVVPKFKNSDWFDQEVGIALGQHKFVISIDKGAVPYGFFGKFQALKSKGKTRSEMAKNIWFGISNNEHTKDKYSEKLVATILNVKSDKEAETFLSVLLSYENVEKRYIEQLHSHYIDNKYLIKKCSRQIANEIFAKYGFESIQVVNTVINNASNVGDLPF